MGIYRGAGGAGIAGDPNQIDGDKGDIVVSSGGLSWVVKDGVIQTANLGGDITSAGKALLDDADASAQRTTLGLGTVATTPITDYATAAQGTVADAALPTTGGTMTGAITTSSTFDGRDVATDGTKLDGVEALADVTDATNVTAAGALMDSELADVAAVKATTGTFLVADQTKLDNIEALADVTDTTNVTSSGALMDSEVTNLAQVKAFDTTDYVAKTSATGSAVMPSGTTGERDGSPSAGNLRFNSTDTSFEGYDGSAWGAIGGGGGGPSLGTDSIIRTNAQTISEDITIPSNTNGMSIGDITIADPYTVTVDGRWVVI